MTVAIQLKTTKDIQLLNDIAFDYGEKIIVTDNGLTSVDARSILALFAFINKKINLVFPDHCDVNKMYKTIKRLAVLA